MRTVSRVCLVVLVALLVVDVSAGAPQFIIQVPATATNPIAASRRVDWTGAGVAGGIPATYTQCVNAACSTVSGGTVTITSINAALSGAPANTYVLLPAGSFTLSDGVDYSGGKQNVILRGAGADQTLLTFTNHATCHGSLAYVCMNSSDTNWKNGNSNSATWSAGYTRGTTVITLSAVTNLKIGNPLILDQLDETNDDGSFPTSDDNTANTHTGIGVGGPYSLEANGGGDQRSGRQQQQIVTVAGCNGSTVNGTTCTGTNVAVTISPGLYMPNWSGSKTPQAWWATSPSAYLGLENLSIDGTSGGSAVGVELFNCSNCWVKGVRSIDTGRAHVRLEYSPRATVRDSYFFLTQNSVSQSYGFECYGGADALVENNIFQAIAAPEMINGNCSGTVVAYNYSINNYYTNSSRYNASANNQHTAGIDSLLFEGNYGNAVYGDNFHGPKYLMTYFRNRWTGPQPACWQSGATYATAVFNTCSSNLSPVVLQSFSRFQNFVGNVLGTTGTNTTTGSVWDLGHGNSNGTVTVPDDPNTTATLMRWGNCHAADSFACNFTSGEVPSGLSGTQASWANAVPTSQTLPTSLYLSAKPGFFGSITWPPIGPDVSGGDVSGTGGHVYMIPAQVCATTTMGLPADGTGPVKSFNAATCYP